jgi:SAM-dependent methyltransferase
MKAKNLVIILGIASCLKNICLGEEDKYKCREQLPSEDLVKFLYQMKLTNDMFTWTGESWHNTLNAFGSRMLGELNARIESHKQQNESSIYNLTEYKPFSLVIKNIIRTLRLCPQDVSIKTTIGNLLYLDFVLLKSKFTNMPIPEEYFPVSEAIANKPFIQIFGECMRTASMGMMRTPSYCEELAQGGKSCDITELDRSIVARVLHHPSDDKTVLFVGFSQTSPAEGGDIYTYTPGYTRSLFLSAWEARPSDDHNQIKTCFCQMPRLLETFPDMRNAFDYIIVGGQTYEYVYPEAWVTFGRMLKPGGRLVYAFYDGIEFFNFTLCLNRTLMESVAEEEASFEWYLGGDSSESVYQEIQRLAGFNNQSIWDPLGEFFYTKEGVAFSWHKKIVPSHE